MFEAGGRQVADAKMLVSKAYSAFNRRDIDGALALMSETVSWPKASEGGRVIGKEGIRAYWNRQWEDFEPQVEPVEMIDYDNGRIAVRVHQIVKSRTGDTLSDTEVWHTFTILNGLIERMDLKETEPGSGSIASSAFSKQ